MKLIRDNKRTELSSVKFSNNVLSSDTSNGTFKHNTTIAHSQISWKILVVDDEPEVHAVTKLSLSDLVFKGKKIELFSAMSGNEAREILANEPNFAVALIDIVMETEDAGLRLINYIRNELCNRAIRLIIRTGQPGSAPERYVIEHYDIDDYKDKTELTAQRLYTTLRTTLKAYQDLATMAHHQQSLSKIIEAAPVLYKIQPQRELFANILNQITQLCPAAANNLLIATIDNTQLCVEEWHTTIHIGTGKFADYRRELQQHSTLINTCNAIVSKNYSENLSPDALLLSLELYQHLFGYIYFEDTDTLSENDKHLLQIMVTQCAMALKNLEFYQTLEAANRQNERKNLFLGMAAHDLRNPLGIIIASEEMLQESNIESFNEEQRQCLDWIKINSHLSLDLVNNLLDIAKIESGQLELELVLTDILPIINKMVSFNRILANTKQIQLHVDYEQNIPPLMIDVSKMQQILSNLLSNAIKYSHSHKNVWIQVKQHHNEVIILVKDEGQGIPQNELPKLFESFSKTSVVGTAGETSTGLGLSICRQIIEAHHGRIWVESTEGVGSTFYVAFHAQLLQ